MVGPEATMPVTGMASARRRAVVWFLLAAVACAIPFIVRPDIDLSIARWLTPQGRFIPADGLVWLVYVGVRPFTYAFVAAVATLTLLSAGLRRRVLGVDVRTGLFLILTLALGHGLVVDVGLKGYWDRARPRDLVEFGGTAHFTGPFIPADQCTENCSFVSGHVAMTFWFIAFAFVAPPPWRLIIGAVVLLAGAGVGLMRMAQGAHFLSDVIFAGFIVVGLTWALHAAMFPRGHRRGA